MSLYMTPTVSYWFMKAPKTTEGAGETDLYGSAFYHYYRGLLETLRGTVQSLSLRSLS